MKCICTSLKDFSGFVSEVKKMILGNFQTRSQTCWNCSQNSENETVSTQNWFKQFMSSDLSREIKPGFYNCFTTNFTLWILVYSCQNLCLGFFFNIFT